MTARRWPIRATTMLTAVVLGGALVPVGTAQAADPPTTVSFTVPGAHDWTVPADVLRVNVVASGGKGGASLVGGWQGGLGNQVLASFRVTPGTVLHLHVGSNGAVATGGANGGGTAGQFAGGGGGGSDIRIGGDALSNRVLVAAGGGGASTSRGGGAAGQPGSLPIGCAAAQPGTSTAGGSGGPTCEGANAGGAGGLGSGGSGGGTTGGGGGGGHYGGGGGGAYGGGAGGSSLVPTGASGVSSALTSTAPAVSLTYAASSPETVAVETGVPTLPADDGTSSTTVTATLIDQNGDHHPGDAVRFGSDDPAVDFGPVTDEGDGSYTAEVSSSNKSGTVTINAYDDSTEPAIQGSTELTMTALAQTVTFDAAAPTGLVVGQSYAPDATGGGSGNTVTFGVDTATTGYGTAAAACSVSGGTASLDHPGSCVLTADQAGNAQYSAAGTANQTVAVGQAATTTSLSVTSSHLTAQVTPLEPGDGVPEGTVTFAVDGTDVGDAPVTDGVATLAHSVPSGEDHLVSATFSGGDDFTGSSTSTSRTDPEITAQLSSTSPSTGGWYRTPVTASFTCTTGGAALTEPCPDPVTLSGSAAGQSVSRTIEATDGGVGTVVVSGINIDRVAPTARVSGVTAGSTYVGTAPAARCTATDALSGATTCTVRLSRTGQTVLFTATATDVAGNTGRATGSYRVLTTYVRGVAFKDGRFQVQGGRRYTILTSTSGSKAPRFLGRVSTSPVTTRGRRFHEVRGKDGMHTWAIKVRVRPRISGPQRFYVLRVAGNRQPVPLSVSPRRP